MNTSPTILIAILAVLAVVVGIYFYISRENMTCELIANSDYIRKNFRSMMDSPQIVRPQNRIRSLMRSGSVSGNYILLAMTFSNPIPSNFSVDIMGDNNVVNHKSTSVTQDINGSLILFEVDRVDFTKMKYLRLNNFVYIPNQNQITRVVFGKYVNGEMTLEPVSKCFIQVLYDNKNKIVGTTVVPVLIDPKKFIKLQNIKMLSQKGGKLGQLVVREGDFNADITSANVGSSGVSDLNNLLDGTNSRTQATISANGFITLNQLRQGKRQLTYVDEIILRNVSGLFPLIITFNYGTYVFDLVYDPKVQLEKYNINAVNMSPIYDYEINALRISFNSILTGSSPIPTPTPEPTPAPIVRTCDKTIYTVTNAPSCENINGVWMRRQLIDYQDTLCEDETKYVDCPADMIPKPPAPEPQPPTPQPSVCPIDAAGLSNLRDTINNLNSMISQRDSRISDLQNQLSSQTCPPCPAQQSCPVTQEDYSNLITTCENTRINLTTERDRHIREKSDLQNEINSLRNQLSSQTCPPQQSCPVTQEQYNQALSDFAMIQNRLEEKIAEFNKLQDNLRNNYISRETYNQHASQCAREIETLKQSLNQCEVKINDYQTKINTYENSMNSLQTELNSQVEGYNNLQSRYRQVEVQLSNLQTELETKMREYNELQNNLNNNYISKTTYDQHVSKCTSDIENLNNSITQLTQLKNELRTRLNKYEPCLDPVLERENGSKYFQVTVCNGNSQLFLSKEEANKHCWDRQKTFLLSSRGIENGNPCSMAPQQKIHLTDDHLFYNNGKNIAPVAVASITHRSAIEDGFNSYTGTASWSGL